MTIATRVLLFLLGIAVAVSAQDVLVVDATGAGDFRQLREAVESASSGDTVLVRSSLPGDVVAVGKALTIVGEQRDVVVGGSLTVRDLAAGAAFIVRNVGFSGTTSGSPGVGLVDNVAQVWLEGVGAVGATGAPGLGVVACRTVTLVSCSVTGGAGADAAPGSRGKGGPGGPGLRVSGTVAVSAFDSGFQGGAGGDGDGASAGDQGGAGVLIEQLEQGLLSGCTAAGGDSGANHPGVAAPGLLVEDAALSYLGTTFVPGTGSELPGTSIQVAAGASPDLKPIDDVPRQVVIDAPLGEFGTGTINYSGEPGDKLTLLFGFAPVALGIPALTGWLHVIPIVVADIGSTPTGSLTVFLDIPAIVPASLNLFLQLVVVGEDGQMRLSAPTMSVIVGG